LRNSECGFTKESIIEKTYSSENLPSPLFSKSREWRDLWQSLPAGRQGREGGIYLQCPYNYGLTNKIESIIEKKMEIPFDP